MQFVSLSKLNSAYGSPFRRVAVGRVSEQRNLIAQLCFSASCFHSQIFRKRSNSLWSGSTSYSIHPLDKHQSLYPIQRKVMAASGSQAVSGDVYVGGLITGCRNFVALAKPTAISFGDVSVYGRQKAGVCSRDRGTQFLCLSMYDISKRTWDVRLLLRPCLRDFRTSSSASYSDGAAADVPFDISAKDPQPENSVDSPGCNVGQTTLRLLSGVCYLPHPDKVKTGGEDAHFICEEKRVIGVADGVGGWADVGVNAGEYARLLMSNSLTAIQQEPEGLVDPARVLEKAHANTKIIGSSTACIIALTDQGIKAINLGDSGFIVIRDGSTVFRSPAQQYGFNFPYQLASGTGGDLPSSGQVFTFPVASGDVIVAGTDGLFDNLYDNEIAALAVQAVRSHQEPQVTAQKIADLAQERALDRNRKTPFSTAAHDAGFRYLGGKLDDITVVVSYVTGADNQ